MLNTLFFLVNLQRINNQITHSLQVIINDRCYKLFKRSVEFVVSFFRQNPTPLTIFSVANDLWYNHIFTQLKKREIQAVGCTCRALNALVPKPFTRIYTPSKNNTRQDRQEFFDYRSTKKIQPIHLNKLTTNDHIEDLLNYPTIKEFAHLVDSIEFDIEFKRDQNNLNNNAISTFIQKFSNIESLFLSKDPLKKFSANRSYDYDYVLTTNDVNHLSNLRELKLYNVNINSSTNSVPLFLPCLKKLTLQRVTEATLLNFFQEASQFPVLEHLELINNFPIDPKNKIFLLSKKLAYLKIDTNSFDLQHCHFPNLREIGVWGRMSSETKLPKNLSKLSRLSLRWISRPGLDLSNCDFHGLKHIDIYAVKRPFYLPINPSKMPTKFSVGIIFLYNFIINFLIAVKNAFSDGPFHLRCITHLCLLYICSIIAKHIHYLINDVSPIYDEFIAPYNY